MTDTVLWLLYLLGGVAAFLAVYARWRIVPSMLAATLITIAGWAALYFSLAEDERPVFWQVDLSLNACFGLIFAGAGAAAAYALQARGESGGR